MLKAKHRALTAAVLIISGSLTWPLIGEMTPTGEVMIAARVAKAAKKRLNKQEQKQAEEQKIDLLNTLYPKEVEEYKALLPNNPAAAAAKMKDMEIKFYKATGTDLEKEFPVKTEEGRLEKLRERFSENANPAEQKTAPAASSASVENTVITGTKTAPTTKTETVVPATTPPAPETAPAPRRGMLRRMFRSDVKEIRNELNKEGDKLEMQK